MANLQEFLFPFHHQEVCNPVAYRVLARDEASGRILTVLEDRECIYKALIAVNRGFYAYLINHSVPTIPLTEAENQARMKAGLSISRRGGKFQ